ncbi:MAG: hypothetical protein PSX80_12385 [bacterium]|nr:hypothetical protein [bacterium]
MKTLNVNFGQLPTPRITSVGMTGGASYFRILSPLIVLVFAISPLGAQSPECPKAELILPSGLVNIEQEATIVLRIVRDFAGSVDWKVSAGTIVNGLGSQVLTLMPHEEDEGKSIKVSARLQGLPNCSVEVSDLLRIAPLPIGEPADVLGKIGKGRFAKSFFQSRLDSYISQLSFSPDDEGLVVVAFDTTASRKYKIAHIKLILEQLKFRHMDPSRITFYISEGESQESTTLWTASPDARIPKYMRTLPTIKGEEFEQQAPNLFFKKK